MTQTPKKSSGFSLLELMITIVIVATLITIALPSYQNSVMASRRTTAQADMTELVNWGHRYYIETNTYPGLADLPFKQSPRSGTAYYKLRPSGWTRGQPGFAGVSASPVGSQASDHCGRLVLTYNGIKMDDGDMDGECWWIS